MNYLNVTYEQLLQDFKARLNSDPRYKNITSSTIYGMFQEMLLACMDMTNFYMQRTAEEAFIDTARLDSSIIKHGKNLGYNPRRPVPAQCELAIRLKGPLPKSLVPGTVIVFSQDRTKLVYNGRPYILDGGYSYTLTQEDIVNGASNDWVKELYFAVPSEAATYIPLQGISYYNTNNTTPIKCFQAERKTIEFKGTANVQKIGETSQFYDIDDLEFCNWYGKRDPYAFYNNKYVPARSWCKVGVGADEDDAFNDDNIYTIETQSIYLNDDVTDLNGEIPLTPLKVCLIDTNSDKTVRLTFSSEKHIVDIGLKSYKDNIYVKYLATKGKAANQTGVKGAVINHSNNIKVNVHGDLIDVTNNVQFIINSDIYGGEDFENQRSIKINAPAYFSSRDKLITKQDFLAHFRALTSPMTVQNALVFGQQEIEDIGDTSMIHNLIQNNIFYCLIGHMYVKNKGNYYVRNVLTELDNTSTDTFSLYGDQYLNHIADYLKMLMSYNSFMNTQYNDYVNEQWLKNIKMIRNNIKHKTEINSVVLSLPPFVQYFDVVGKVFVKPMVDIEAYNTRMKNKIFEYLDEQAALDRKIYKSDIIRLYNEDDDTRSVDIDIKVSHIIKSDTMSFEWDSRYTSDFEVAQNKDLASFKQAFTSDTPTPEELTAKYGGGWWNQIVLPNIDSYGNKINTSIFKNKRITIEMECNNRYHSYAGKSHYVDATAQYPTKHTYILQCDVSEDNDKIILAPNAIQSQYSTYWPLEKISGQSDSTKDIMQHSCYRYHKDDEYRNGNYTSSINTNSYMPNNTQQKIIANDSGIISLKIITPTYDDYYSTSKFNTMTADDYKLSGNEVNEIEAELNKWLSEELSVINSVQRSINLPYIVNTNTVATRTETIERRGNIIALPENTLSEQSFWTYFVPKIIRKYYDGKGIHGKIDEESQITGEAWVAATKLIKDLYALVKPGICDSILDANNNITNFSTSMEIAVLDNLVEVEYEN